VLEPAQALHELRPRLQARELPHDLWTGVSAQELQRGEDRALLVLALPRLDAWLVLDAVGLARAEHCDYQRGMLAASQSLAGGRNVPTNGLPRAEYEACLDLLEPAVPPGTRVGWVGVSNIFSPGAMHVGLVARGAGSPAAIRDGHPDKCFVETGYSDPGWSEERILAWAERFDLILTTQPIDLSVPENRRFLERYRQTLITSGRWIPDELGALTVQRPTKPPVRVQVYGLRPAGASGTSSR
jgi:hypothetical protein